MHRCRAPAAIEVALIEDHPTFRFGLRTRLELEDDLVVIGEADTADEALELIDRLALDVMIVDISLRGIDGVTLIRRLGLRAARRTAGADHAR